MVIKKEKIQVLYDLKSNQNILLKMKTERTFTGVCKGNQTVHCNAGKQNVTIFKPSTKESNCSLISACALWWMALIQSKQIIYIQHCSVLEL